MSLVMAALMALKLRSQSGDHWNFTPLWVSCRMGAASCVKLGTKSAATACAMQMNECASELLVGGAAPLRSFTFSGSADIPCFENTTP